MRRLWIVGLVLISVLLQSGPAAAGGSGGNRSSARERYDEAVAAFPAPSTKEVYRKKFVVETGGVALGTWLFSISVGKDGGWVVHDHLRVPSFHQDLSETVHLSRQLVVGRGNYDIRASDSSFSARWRRRDLELHMTTQTEAKGAGPKVHDFTFPPDGLATVAGVLLFCRLVPARSATYGIEYLSPQVDSDQFVNHDGIEVTTGSKWRGRSALLCRLTDSTGTCTLALDPESRDLLGIHMAPPHAVPYDAVPEGTTLQLPKEGSIQPPARTPRGAAAIVALSCTTGDGQTLGEITDWKAALRHFREAHPKRRLTVAEFRRQTLAWVTAHSAKVPRAVVIGALLSVMNQLTVRRTGKSTATVAFPASLGGESVDVEKKKGLWLLATLPSSENYAATVAGFPAPSKANEFHEELDEYVGGVNVGSLSLSATAAERKGQSVWSVRDRKSLPAWGSTRTKSAILTSTLGAVEGSYEFRGKKGSRATRWACRHGVVRLVSKDQDSKTLSTTKRDKMSRAPLATLTAHVLLCRLVGPHVARYRFASLYTDSSGSCELASELMTSRGMAKWRGRNALLFDVAMDSGDHFTIALDPKTRAVLGIHIENQGMIPCDYVPSGEKAKPLESPFYEPPAEDARQVGTIAALAWSTGDVQLFSRVVDWRDAYHAFEASHSGDGYTLQEFRRVAPVWINTPERVGSAVALRADLAALRSGLSVHPTTEVRATLNFPSFFGVRSLDVAKQGKSWFIVRLPEGAENYLESLLPYYRAAAGFPAPSKKNAFHADLVAYVGGVSMGTASFSASPTKRGGKTIWRVKGRESLPTVWGTENVSEDLSRTMSVLVGVDRTSRGARKRIVTWEDAGKGYRVTVEDAGGPVNTAVEEPCPSKMLVNYAQLVLLCRLLPSKVGQYRVISFTPYDANHGSELNDVYVVSKGEVRWRGREALVFQELGSNGSTTVALDPENRALFGVEVATKGTVEVDLLSKSIEVSPAPATLFAPPAKGPRQAALIAAFALYTGNAALFAKIVDWKSAYRAMKASQPGYKDSAEAFRKQASREVTGEASKVDATTARALLGAVLDRIVVHETGTDRATVDFPKWLWGLHVEVGKVGDTWRVLKIPSE